MLVWTECAGLGSWNTSLLLSPHKVLSVDASINFQDDKLTVPSLFGQDLEAWAGNSRVIWVYVRTYSHVLWDILDSLKLPSQVPKSSLGNQRTELECGSETRNVTFCRVHVPWGSLGSQLRFYRYQKVLQKVLSFGNTGFSRYNTE